MAAALLGVAAAEAARLDADLTPVGAEKAGNKDGTIPAWTGGLCSPPAGWTAAQGYTDPFASDKVLFTITKANAAHRLPAAGGVRRHQVDGHADRPQRLRVHGRLLVHAVPDPEERSRGDLEPRAALPGRWRGAPVQRLPGAPDRYDWKLVGKKEVYVPYNAYKLSDKKLKYKEDIIRKNTPNADLMRYELHRVWEVEAILKRSDLLSNLDNEIKTPWKCGENAAWGDFQPDSLRRIGTK